MPSAYDEVERVTHQFEQPPYDAWQGVAPWVRISHEMPFADIQIFTAYNEDEIKVHEWMWLGALVQLPSLRPAIIDLHHKIIAALGRLPIDNDVFTFSTRTESVDGEVRVFLDVIVKAKGA